MTTDLLLELNHEVGRAIARLYAHPRASVVLRGAASREQLCEYLRNAYFVVQVALPLLRQTFAQLKRDRAHPALIALFDAKCEEEAGHEQWLLDDLEALGMPLTEEQARHPSRASTLYRDFNQQIIALNGQSFLGTAYVLESFSLKCAASTATNLRQSGVIAELRPGSDNGVSFFVRHADADVAHIEELGRIIERYVTDEEAKHWVLLTARFTGAIYADIF